MKISQLVEWFQLNYPQMHYDLLYCRHNFDTEELNPFHLESDCWSHTMMVCKMAELNSYNKLVCIAALLHDIGKPVTRKINPHNNHVQFFGHEEISAQMAEVPLEQMIHEGILTQEEKRTIVKLIRHHAILYKHPEISDLLAYFDGDKIFCGQLIALVKCDSLGRFSPDLSDEKRFDDMLSFLDANS